MNSKWLESCRTDEERKELTNLVKNNKYLLDKLNKVCYNIKQDLELTKSGDFDCPNWAFKRAFQDGQIKQLNDLINLLNTTDRVEKV